MENITEKIKVCKYPENSYPTISKFLGGLTLVSSEEIKQINDYLTSKGIVLKPVHNTVYLNTFEEIKNRVELLESLNLLDIYIQNPKRINCKSLIERINYLNSQGISLKDENGKYLECLFSKRAFEAKFGTLEELKNKEEEIKIETPEIEKPKTETPVVENTFTEAKVEPREVFNTDLSSFDKVKESLKYLDTELSSLENLNVNEPKNEIKQVKEENELSTAVNPIEEILAKPQTVNVDDEAFNKFERLYQSIRHILIEVYGAEEVNESIANNLMKLVTSGITDDIEIIYNAITYKKDITEEEKQRLLKAINEEVEYTSILDINLGMVA